MTKPNFIRSKNAFAAVLFVCIFAFNCPAQTPATRPQQQGEPSYEVVLQVLSASNGASDKSAEAVPQMLSAVVKKLKTMYSFSNYRVSSTYVQRVANTGSLEFKGVLTAANQDVYTPIFSDFSLSRLLTVPNASGQNSISIDNFRFGQRVPIRTANYSEESGKSNSVINYEQVGLTMRKIDLPADTPTIIGNLSATKSDEMSFLILTVRQTE